MADLATTVQRWKDSSAQGQTRYQEGIQATTVDVVQRAISAQPKLVANFNQAVSSGFWARRLADVGTGGWKQAAIAKAGNYATGIQAGEQAYQRQMQVWLPIIQSAAAATKAMPNATFADSVARATHFMTTLHNAKLAR